MGANVRKLRIVLREMEGHRKRGGRLKSRGDGLGGMVDDELIDMCSPQWFIGESRGLEI